MLRLCGRRWGRGLVGGGLLLGAATAPSRCASDAAGPAASAGCLPGDPLGTVMVLTVAGIVATEYTAMVLIKQGLLPGAPVATGQVAEKEAASAAAALAAAQAAKAQPRTAKSSRKTMLTPKQPAGKPAPAAAPVAAVTLPEEKPESDSTWLYLALLAAGLGAAALVVWKRQSSGTAVVAAAANAEVGGGAAVVPLAAAKAIRPAGPAGRHGAVNAYLTSVYPRDRLPPSPGPPAAAAGRSEAAVQSVAAAADAAATAETADFLAAAQLEAAALAKATTHAMSRLLVVNGSLTDCGVITEPF